MMKSCTSFVFSLVLSLPISLWAEETPLQRWAANYNGSSNGIDKANAIAVGTSGNVYVTGYSYSATTREDYATVKYDPNGNQQWVARYNGPADSNDYAVAMAVDTSGNVYVTGYSKGCTTYYDCATVKYDTNGNQKWVARYNGPANSTDYALALAIDDLGNVYITGYSYGSGTYDDYVTIKYDTNGTQKWAARYNGLLGSVDRASAVTVDNSGNVYVTGYSYGAGTYNDYATIKYDTNGNQKWVALYSGPSVDEPNAIAVDNFGNVYVTGSSYALGAYYDYATIKYDPNGSQKWLARYNGPSSSTDKASAIAVDGLGNIYVTGYSYGGLGINDDYTTIKYDPNGSQKWVAYYNGPSSYIDKASDVAVDGQGNIYVTGYSYVGSGTNYDYATVKYDTNGTELWAVRYDGPSNQTDVARSLAVDNSGNVYVTGYSRSSTSYDYATIKYTQHHYCTAALAGDLNGDYEVDFSDLAILTSYWLQTGTIAADLNSDGKVNFADFAILASHWFQTGTIEGDLNCDCKVNFTDFAILADDWLEGSDWADLAELAGNWLKCNFALQEDCW